MLAPKGCWASEELASWSSFSSPPIGGSEFLLTAVRDRLTIPAMQTTHPVKRGGARIGAGRPRGSGCYGEPTVSIRVPVSAMDDVQHLIETGKMRLPLLDLAKLNAKPAQ